MPIRRFSDIEKEKREDFKKDISNDINDVMDNVFNRKKKTTWFGFIVRIFLFLLALLVIVNLVLGNIWLLKFLIKDLFLG